MNHPLTITADSTGGYTTIYDTSICIGLTRDELLGTIAAWLYKGEPQFSGVKVADIVKPTAEKLEKVARALFNNSTNEVASGSWENLTELERDAYTDLARIAFQQIASNI